tara:strand:+ start:9607 stop:10890 length:1284 start_codon:yes stop_codon:yes gene_type:complete
MKKFIFIAGINRSGGSLLARLFDGHSNIASYPMEIGFPFKEDIYGFVDNITGSPTYLPSFKKNLNLKKYFNIEKEEPVFSWGKEKSEKFGVRNNYIEKAFYETNINTNFDHDAYVSKLNQYCKNSENNQELYSGKHKAYFESWDNGKNIKDPKVVILHDSNGLFLNDFDKYYEDFDKSIVAVPIRNIMGYVAAEKTRIARRFFGSRRFSKPFPPKFLIKQFNQYDLHSIIRTWNTSITRIRLLQEKFSINGNFIVYRFENLAEDPKKIIDYLCEKVEIKSESILYEPTLMNKPWMGNSQQGKNKGINKNPNDYSLNILREDEIKMINKETGNIMREINRISECPVDLTKIEEDYFFDYIKHKKFSQNNDSWSLYCAFAFSGFRKLKLSSVSWIGVIAIMFKLLVRIWHIPRLFKLKYFKGLGKQNYT